MAQCLERVTAFAPATVANVGSAFDVLGFALDAPGDTVTVSRTTTPGVTITAIHGDQGRLSTRTEENTAGVSIVALLNALKQRFPGRFDSIGLSVELTKGLPIGSGLGSSSASTVAAVVAAQELLGVPLPRTELLQYAMEGELTACGSAHADNVGPSLLGGFVLIRSYDPLEVIQLPTPSTGAVAVVHPHVEVRTSDARKILKKSVALHTAISQWGNVAALIAGIYRDDLELMGRSLQDAIIEPERGQLIPGYADAKQAARVTGAFGCAISGSGPSLFSLCRDSRHAEEVATAMAASFAKNGIHSTQHISGFNRTGASIIERQQQT
jgi:homoserine kinase